MTEIPTETRIAPGLLIAMPQLVDPHFYRAVVLMVEHQDVGSFGLVMNHPGAMPVSALAAGFDVAWSGDPDAAVGIGGPVMAERGWIVYEPDPDAEAGPGHIVIAPGLALSNSAETLKLFAARPPRRVRFVMGYAGWGPGQLAAEMEAGSWLHAEVDAALLFETESTEMWRRALSSIGVEPMAVVPGHGIN